jgi:hypothetical protein
VAQAASRVSHSNASAVAVMATKVVEDLHRPTRVENAARAD